jgi:hypothetical protein
MKIYRVVFVEDQKEIGEVEVEAVDIMEAIAIAKKSKLWTELLRQKRKVTMKINMPEYTTQ